MTCGFHQKMQHRIVNILYMKHFSKKCTIIPQSEPRVKVSFLVVFGIFSKTFGKDRKKWNVRFQGLQWLNIFCLKTFSQKCTVIPLQAIKCFFRYLFRVYSKFSVRVHKSKMYVLKIFPVCIHRGVVRVDTIRIAEIMTV